MAGVLGYALKQLGQNMPPIGSFESAEKLTEYVKQALHQVAAPTSIVVIGALG
jgi:hypothetical protein